MNDAQYPPIGITGFKQAGKDTVARVLHAQYNYRIFGYSEVLKEHLYNALTPEVRGDLPTFLARLERDKNLPHEDPNGFVRSLLQGWGQAHRVLGGITYWTRRLEVWPRQVIPSVRHPDEVAHLRRHGALIWRVTRPGTSSDGHPSEASVPHLEVDTELANVGTLDDLAAQVQQAMTRCGVDNGQA